MEERISERLLDQRLRNRVMEAVEWLADGVDEWGAREYIVQFDFQMGMDSRPEANSTYTEEEWRALNQLCDLMDRVCNATPIKLTDEAFAASGLEIPVRQEARRVLDIFLKRGRFSETQEQGAPLHLNRQPSPSLQDFISQQREIFTAAHPQSKALSQKASVWRSGVPMHWMQDWATPFPIYVKFASQANLTDVDDHLFDDFCLGDTPSMFGHARPELQAAIAHQAGEGVGFMLPMPLSNAVGDLLRERFGMDQWQVATTASDANRAVIRWARAITGRDKILVFDGCYHGMVEDGFVALYDGVPANKKGLIGQVHDQTKTTTVIPFNDLAALETALSQNEIAAVLAEPVMTNCGMITPDPGFLDAMQDLCRRTGTLLILDETHTLSSGPGGYTGVHGLKPDMFVVGKAIAGGIPAAVWGVTAEVAARMDAAQAAIGPGQSGIGTTLSGNALVMRAIHTVLTQIATPAAFNHMLSGAQYLVEGLNRVIAAHNLPWCTVHVGARVELVFAPEPPRNAAEMRRHLDHDLLEAFHLFLINQGILIAPFHNMMLISPQTGTQSIDRLIAAVDAFAEPYRTFA